jgi:hypothetical protein
MGTDCVRQIRRSHDRWRNWLALEVIACAVHVVCSVPADWQTAARGYWALCFVSVGLFLVSWRGTAFWALYLAEAVAWGVSVAIAWYAWVSCVQYGHADLALVAGLCAGVPVVFAMGSRAARAFVGARKAMGEEETFQDLLRALADDDPALRAEAAFAIGLSGRQEGVRELVRALEDVDVGVRVRAIRGLGRLADRACLAALRAKAGDDSEEELVRREAAIVIRRLE